MDQVKILCISNIVIKSVLNIQVLQINLLMLNSTTTVFFSFVDHRWKQIIWVDKKGTLKVFKMQHILLSIMELLFLKAFSIIIDSLFHKNRPIIKRILSSQPVGVASKKCLSYSSTASSSDLEIFCHVHNSLLSGTRKHMIPSQECT